MERRRSDARLARFSQRLVEINFIVFEVGMLVVFVAGVYAVVAHELLDDPRGAFDRSP